jgi:hypothetical protein
MQSLAAVLPRSGACEQDAAWHIGSRGVARLDRAWGAAFIYGK